MATQKTLDQLYVDPTLVSAKMLTYMKEHSDYATHFNNDFVEDINNKRTNTATITLAPDVVFSDMPAAADRNGLLARTGAEASTVDVTLTADKYYKVGVDELGIDPEKNASLIGTSGGRGLLAVTNRNIVDTLAAQGTAQYFGTGAQSAQKNWEALTELYIPFVEASYTEELTAFVDTRFFYTITKSYDALKGISNAEEVAAKMLKVDRIELTSLGEGNLAVIAHKASLAHPRRAIPVQVGKEDFDLIVEGRVKFGSKVLKSELVQVLKAGAAPVEG